MKRQPDDGPEFPDVKCKIDLLILSFCPEGLASLMAKCVAMGFRASHENSGRRGFMWRGLQPAEVRSCEG